MLQKKNLGTINQRENSLDHYNKYLLDRSKDTSRQKQQNRKLVGNWNCQ